MFDSVRRAQFNMRPVGGKNPGGFLWQDGEETKKRRGKRSFKAPVEVCGNHWDSFKSHRRETTKNFLLEWNEINSFRTRGGYWTGSAQCRNSWLEIFNRKEMGINISTWLRIPHRWIICCCCTAQDLSRKTKIPAFPSLPPPPPRFDSIS